MQRRISTVDEIPATAKPLNEAAQVAASMPMAPQDEPNYAGTYEPWPNEIEFTLPDGRVVVMKPPVASLPFLAANLLATANFASPLLMQAEIVNVNALLFIHSIDGEVITKPHDSISRSALEQKIGARFTDLIVTVFMDNFPAVGKSELKIIKK
jgi:hypothetical protein